MNLPGGDPGAQNFLADPQNLYGLGFGEHLGLATTNRALRLRGRHGSPERLAPHGSDRYFDSSFRNSFCFGPVNNSGAAAAFISQRTTHQVTDLSRRYWQAWIFLPGGGTILASRVSVA